MRVRILAAFAVVLVCASGLLVSASIAARSADRATAKLAARDAERAARAAEAVDTYFRHKSGGKVEVRGVVQVVHGDPKNQKGDGEFHYALQLENNRRVPITLPPSITRGAPKDEPVLQSGQIIAATGTPGSTGGEVIVTSIDRDGDLPLYGPQPITTDPSTHRGPTSRTALVIPVAYADDPAAGPFNLTEVQQNLQGAGGGSVADYFRHTSAGFESAPLPATAGDIVDFNFQIRDAVHISTNRPASAENCSSNPELNTQAINKQLGIDPLSASYGQYDHYLYLMPCNMPGAWADGAVRGADSRYYAADSSTWPVGVFVHELGHNLGLHHTNRTECTVSGIAAPTSSDEADCTSVEYGGGGDVMGGDGLLSPYHRAELGFLPVQNTERVTPTEGRVLKIISSTTRASLGTRQLVQVPRPKAAAAGSNRPYYYLGIRGAKAPFESRPASHPLYTGVELQRSTSYAPNYELQPETVQTHPFAGATPTGETRFDQSYSLTNGRSFYDPVENYTIAVRGVVAGGNADVTVEPGPPRGAATAAGVTSGRLIVRASGTSSNSVSIRLDGSDLVVADFGNVLTPGAGCSRPVAANPQIVRCPTAAISAISVLLGSGDDQASVASNVTQPTTLDGSFGNDTLIAAGAGADVITGGPGQDFLDPSGSGSDTISFVDHAVPVTFDQASAKPWIVTSALGNDEIARSGSDVVAFERLVGGSSPDVLRWTQGTFGRTVDGGAGADTVKTGPGSDIVYSRDGVADASIDCGDGSDVYDGDASDPATSCNAMLVQPVITAGPAENDFVRPSANPTFTIRDYLSTEAFQCQVSPDQTTYAPCGTSYALPTTLTDGPKTLIVRAVVNGVAVNAPVRRNFTVDSSAPTVSVTSTPPSYDTGRYSTFAFSSNEQAGRFMCTIDGVELGCQSPVSYADLEDGNHTFSVRALDQAGNTSPSSAVTTWTVGRNLPDTQITAGPTDTSTAAQPRFDFTSTGPAAAGFDCRFVPLDGVVEAPAFTACSAPTYHQPAAPLAPGRYRFEVRARNAAGGADQSPATREFVQVPDAGTVTLASGRITVTAAPGKTNNLRVRPGSNNTIVVDDVVPLQSVGCVQVTTKRVTCPAAGVTYVYVYGGDLDDSISADAGSLPTSLFGQDGNDTLRGVGTARDAFFGGAGTDTVTYAGFPTTVTMSPGSTSDDGPVTGTRDLIVSDVENLTGGNMADVLTGVTAGAVLDGGPAGDLLYAPAGGAVFRGSEGNDRFVGGSSANDVVDFGTFTASTALTVDASTGKVSKTKTVGGATQTATDTATGIERWLGSPGNDRFIGSSGVDDFSGRGGSDGFSMTPGGLDRIDGGDDTDSVTYTAYTTPVRVNLDGATPTGGADGDAADVDTLVSIEGAGGGGANDIVIGNAAGNSLSGGPGDDTLRPGPSNIASGDFVNGGTGEDTLDLSAATRGVSFDLWNGNGGLVQTAADSAGPAVIVGALAMERFVGGSGNDVMTHSDGGLDVAATFEGGPGNDTLTGGNKNDRLIGGAGADILTGGAGFDVLDSGDGIDKVYARDGLNELVSCGTGSPDVAELDAGDVSGGCETLLP